MPAVVEALGLVIADRIGEGIIIVDAGGNVAFCNRAAQEMLRHSGDLTPERAGELARCRGQVWTDGRVKAVVDSFPWSWPGEGEGFVIILRDVTQQEKLRQENTELNRIIDNFYDGIVVLDKNAVGVRVNPAVERLTGLRPGEIVGQSMAELEQKGVLNEAVAPRVLREKKPVTIIQGFYTGKEALVTGNPILDEHGEVVQVVTNIRDMTELNELRRQLEQQKQLTVRYLSELAELRLQMFPDQSEEVVARSKAMQDILDVTTRLANFDVTIFITGESGVGKEVIARLMHKLSPRVEKGSFIRINCGAIPRELMESELFGYERGAFTGARHEGKPGMFELAHRGTLFLDEVTELPPDLQVKLLRVLQDQEIMRLGSTRPVKVDVRIVAASNRDVAQLVRKGEFREDLYFRLNVVPLHIPPLRERREDIPVLLSHFLQVFNTKYGTEKYFTAQLIDLLTGYTWPGNVRELANLVERLVVTTPGECIDLASLPQLLKGNVQAASNTLAEPEIIPLPEALADVERRLVQEAVKAYGSTYKAALVLGVSQSTVVRKLRKYKSS